MSPCRPALLTLAASILSGIACTPSASAARQPTATADMPAETRDVAPPSAQVESPLGADSTAEACTDVAPPPPPVAISRPIAVPPATSQYRVRIVDDAGRSLPTYQHDGRSYVQGTIGSRYSIVLTNATPRRVEAVVSVDGLDAMDGHPASYVEHRGYIVPAWGNMSIDGFRTSLSEVATFRFSSVADSYAGRVGQARDVGVIGVAFFDERQRIAYVPRPIARPRDDYGPPPRKAQDRPAPGAGYLDEPSADVAPTSPPAATGAGGADLGRMAPAHRAAATEAQAKVEERRGLGTEFGEARGSQVNLVDFERANPSHPTQVVAVRYNDRAGLIALGIPIPPPPRRWVDPEVTTRETADPFPAMRFAQPPP